MKKPCEMGNIFHKAFFMQRKLRGVTYVRFAHYRVCFANSRRSLNSIAVLLSFFTQHNVCKDTEDKGTGNCADFYGAEAYYHSANTSDKDN